MFVLRSWEVDRYYIEDLLTSWAKRCENKTMNPRKEIIRTHLQSSQSLTTSTLSSRISHQRSLFRLELKYSRFFFVMIKWTHFPHLSNHLVEKVHFDPTEILSHHQIVNLKGLDGPGANPPFKGRRDEPEHITLLCFWGNVFSLWDEVKRFGICPECAPRSREGRVGFCLYTVLADVTSWNIH